MIWPRPSHIDWHAVAGRDAWNMPAADFRLRLRCLGAGLGALLLVALVRLTMLECYEGEAWRAAAVAPIQREVPVPAPRGRILARDGSPLAYDQPSAGLALHYRRLQWPLDPQWLRTTARGRLSREQRRDPARLAVEETRVQLEVRELHARLAQLCGLSDAEWEGRCDRIQRQVERIVAAVNDRSNSEASTGDGWLDGWRWPAGWRIGPAAAESGRADRARRRIVIAEELAYHRLVDDLPLAAVAEIGQQPERFPGVRIEQASVRAYRLRNQAAHVVGYVGAADRAVSSESTSVSPLPSAGGSGADVGLTGIERLCESALAACPGRQRLVLDRSGQISATELLAAPRPGQDVVLTLDAGLQTAAQQHLAAALQRQRRMRTDAAESSSAGGAVVVMDVHTGAVLAAASAPSFDPGTMMAGGAAAADLLNDSAYPLLDRTCQMALPPGSVFKLVTAAALLESGTIDPAAPFDCQGYLQRSDALRCAIFRQHGFGHGPVRLSEALAESCNVYFFHYAPQLPPTALGEWAARCGFGRPCGADWNRDLPGHVPAATLSSPLGLDELRQTSIGQGRLTATPLQMACLMAALANGGRLVRPHVVQRVGLVQFADQDADQQTPAPHSARDELRISTAALVELREGLRQATLHPRGTAFPAWQGALATAAGKTGTAEVGGGRASHAWFACYAPADRPRVAAVAVLEHAGDAAVSAVPLMRGVLDEMARRGIIDAREPVVSARR